MSSVDVVTARMEDMAERTDLPSNVKELLEEAASELQDQDKEISVRVSSAASKLDRVSNDPNIKQHTRTEIWNLASKVEGLE